jgi:membrane protein required for colicin V production
MNVADVVIAIILVIGVASGLSRGFIRGLFGLAALVLGVRIAAGSYDRVADSVLFFVPGDFGPEIVSFVLIFLLVLIAIGWLGRVIAKALKLAALGWLDRLAGGVLGFIMASVVIGIALLVAIMAGLERTSVLVESRLAPRMLRVTDAIVSVVPDEARGRFERGYEELRARWEASRRSARAEAAPTSSERPSGPSGDGDGDTRPS